VLVPYIHNFGRYLPIIDASPALDKRAQLLVADSRKSPQERLVKSTPALFALCAALRRIEAKTPVVTPGMIVSRERDARPVFHVKLNRFSRVKIVLVCRLSRDLQSQTKRCVETTTPSTFAAALGTNDLKSWSSTPTPRQCHQRSRHSQGYQSPQPLPCLWRTLARDAP